MSITIKKILTENPFIDELVYNTKLIALNSIVKDGNKAGKYETLETSKAFNLYSICYEGRAVFELFSAFPYSVLVDALTPKYTSLYIKRYFLNDIFAIPEADRAVVVKHMSDYVINNYVEQNDYYRELSGSRPLADTVNIPLADFGLTEEYSDRGTYKYVHELPDQLKYLLYSEGKLDDIISQYPDEKYLQYFGKGITFYNARKAENFDLLYIPSETEVDETIRNKYIDKYEVNRMYALTSIYSEAFKLQSDYYDNFIAILIVVMTITDMLAEVQEHIVRRDILDQRCIEYIFEQYGIPYYDEIPVKYQINMMKNLNTLLKFKSTAKCMVDICSLFGFDSTQIFQFYILRNRKINASNEYVFNYIKKNVPNKCEPTIKKTNTAVINQDTDSVDIPYPFDDYVTKGNKMIVYLDDIILPDTYYYTLGTKLYFLDKKVLKDKQKLTFKFLYNEDDSIIKSVPDHSIITEYQYVDYSKDQTVYTIKPPVDNYFALGGKLYLILGSLYVMEDVYTINTQTNQVTFTDTTFLKLGMDSKQLRVMYVYSSAIKVNYKDVHVAATEDRQTQFKVPEPKEGYCDAGSDFFITRGNTLIVKDRYHVSNGFLIFDKDDDYVQKGRSVDFHFVWNDFNTVELITTTSEVIATESYQTSFDVPLPNPDYFVDNNPVFVEVNGTPIPSTDYAIVKNRLVITNTAYGVYKGNSIKFIFVYPKVTDIHHDTRMVQATKDKQTDFVIPLPYDKFLYRGNKMIVSYNGIVYDTDKDFTVRGNILEIYSIAKAVDKDTELKFDFYYLDSNKDYIAVKYAHAQALTDDQLVYAIDFPFYRYMDSGNKFFISIGSLFVDESLYDIVQDKLVFKAKLDRLIKDRNVTYTFIYHTIYERYNKAVHIDNESYDLSDSELSADGALKVKIPFPFDDYLDLGNSFDISIGGHTIPQKDYDIIDKTYAVIYDAKDTVFKYGNNIQFIFVYTCTGFKEEVVEDINNDVELKFVKIPILSNPDKYLKNKNNYMNYDIITEGDPSWDSEYDHDDIKAQLLNREFSYNRTKYFSLTTISSMADLCYQMPYFLNMLFDDVIKEERLKLLLPYINQTHMFKLNDTFTYLFALTHLYMGIEDDIPVTQDKVLFVKGFNFQADLAKLAQNIKDIGRNPDDFGFTKFMIPKYQVESYKQLIQIFTQNTDVYKFVTYQMTNASNKTMYDIYKNLYDSLMIIKETKKYYSLPNGPIAPTLTEFLHNRDTYLYSSIMKVKAIADEKDRKKLIIQYIQDAVYQIDEYIDSKEFKYIFHSLAGENGDYILNYLKKIISFFKSYKAQIYDLSTNYLFDDKFENTIRAIDQVILTSVYDKDDYGQNILEAIYTNTDFTSKENGLSNFKENLKVDIKHWLFQDVEDTYHISDMIGDMIVSFTLKDKCTIIDALAELISVFVKDDRYDMIDSLSVDSTLIPKDTVKILENIRMDISRLKELGLKDIAEISEKIYDMLVHLNLIDPKYVIKDQISEILVNFTTRDKCNQNESFDYISNLKQELRITPLENILINANREVYIDHTDLYKFTPILVDLISVFNKSQFVNIIESIATKANMIKVESGSPEDTIASKVSFSFQQKVEMATKLVKLVSSYTRYDTADLLEKVIFNISLSYSVKIVFSDGMSIGTNLLNNETASTLDKIASMDIEWFKPINLIDNVNIKDDVKTTDIL